MRELSCGQDVANVEVVMACSFPCCQDPVSANSRFCLVCCWSDAKPLQYSASCENTNYSWTVQELKFILESQNGLSWKGPLKRSSLTPLSSPGCSKFHSTWPWRFPGMEYSQLLQANLIAKNLCFTSSLNLSFFSLKLLSLVLLLGALIESLSPSYRLPSFMERPQ